MVVIERHRELGGLRHFHQVDLEIHLRLVRLAWRRCRFVRSVARALQQQVFDLLQPPGQEGLPRYQPQVLHHLGIGVALQTGELDLVENRSRPLGQNLDLQRGGACRVVTHNIGLHLRLHQSMLLHDLEHGPFQLTGPSGIQRRGLALLPFDFRFFGRVRFLFVLVGGCFLRRGEFLDDQLRLDGFGTADGHGARSVAWPLHNLIDEAVRVGFQTALLHHDAGKPCALVATLQGYASDIQKVRQGRSGVRCQQPVPVSAQCMAEFVSRKGLVSFKHQSLGTAKLTHLAPCGFGTRHRLWKRHDIAECRSGKHEEKEAEGQCPKGCHNGKRLKNAELLLRHDNRQAATQPARLRIVPRTFYSYSCWL